MQKQSSYTRLLFGTAAAFNFMVASGLLFLRDAMGALLAMEPVTGSNILLANLAGALVGVFGYAYARVAQQPVRYRAYAELGTIGKLLVLPAAAIPWMQGVVGWQLPLLACGDLVYALLFWDWLRRTR
ncbi:MAG TPA: hypothetical protein VLI06_00100 [Solimonas sp.]|nr:hypothetical protein [Solimonas sp.]